ncbi:MAG: ABC transporter substrate-binding protein [Halorhabdus sp.]
MATNRREFMRKMGVTGAAVGSVSIAGCSAQTNPDGGGGGTGTVSKNVESDLPEERKVGEKVHVSNTERYYAARYQANALVDKRFRDDLGVPVQTKPVEITVLVSREEKGDFHLVTYNWSASNGDPDGIIYDRFHKNGSLNYYGFNNQRYNELAAGQRRETDEDARQEMVSEAQKILGEQRPENQYLYNVTPYGYNSDAIDPESIVVNDKGLRNIWNYTQMEPTNENGRVIVTNNWDPSDQLNPLHLNAVGPSRNWTPTRFMHDFLFRPDPDLKMTPWAASGYEYTGDTTLEVSLKEGMTFHDGESVTADDVKYTFDLIMETEPPAYINNVVQTTESVEKTGELGLRFNLTEPYAPYIALTLGMVPILPQHVWKQRISETGNEKAPWKVPVDNDMPIVGSGPFKYGTWDQGSRFRMPAFKEHSFAAPNIDTRVQNPLSTRDAEMEALIQGNYDLLDYWFGSPRQLSDVVEKHDQLSMVQNSGQGRQATWVNMERPPFDDVAFRQATNALIMGLQPTTIEELYDGFGKEAISPINPTLKFWHNPDTPYFKNGAEGAITILNDAGYVWNKDGELHYPEGKTGE